jgi:hypothetical protein
MSDRWIVELDGGHTHASICARSSIDGEYRMSRAPGGAMTKFYVLEPEVAGVFGTRAVCRRSADGDLMVAHLHYKLDSWLAANCSKTHPASL